MEVPWKDLGWAVLATTSCGRFLASLSITAGGGCAGCNADGIHMLPADRLGDLLRQAGIAIGAVDVSMWLVDYGQAFLKPSEDGR